MRGPDWSEETIARFEAEGRGRGTGAAFKPWLTVADLSSLGRSRRPWSDKTGRHHELFSDVEYDLFLCLEWGQDVVDIREQYPLDRDITQELARTLGLRHPHYPRTQTPTVMTVDFLVTRIRSGERLFEAFNAKRDEEAEDHKSLEKLEIQRAYFEQLGSPHHLVFHSAIPRQKANNYAWVRDALLKPGESEPQTGYFADLMARMAAELANSAGCTQLRDYCTDFDHRYGATSGTGLRVARMLIHQRTLVTDMASSDIAAESMDKFIVAGSKARLRALGGK